MASKIIIPMPTAAATPFQNIVQNNLERKDFLRMLPASESSSSATSVNGTTTSKDALLKINELEKTVRFLKDEQKCMLFSLHQEIASLQVKNRDLLCQLIFNSENNFEYTNSISDNDVKYILMSHEKSKKQQIPYSADIKEQNCSVNDVYELRYALDQQQREIEYLKGQLELVTVRNKTQNRESRQADNYIREVEERNRDQEKLVRLLRKENKEHKMEIENLRKTLNSVRISNHVPQSMQMTHVQPQAQLFPAVGTPSTFWYQNRPLPITDYHQMQRNSISANGGDRPAGSLPNVQFTLPPVCNYRQIAVTAPPPRYYSNATNCYYSVAQRPVVRSKSYGSENGARSPNKNITNGSNV